MVRRIYSSDLTASKRPANVFPPALWSVPIILALGLVLCACSLGPSASTSQAGSNPTTGTSYPPAAAVPLAQLPWCRYNTQQPRFWDYGGSAVATPAILTGWSQIQAQLGFTVYLPARLSADACLTGVEGDLRLPTANTFRITYDYYQRTYTNRLILFEQPASASQTKMQCESLADYTSQDSTHFPIAPLEPPFQGTTNSSSNPVPSICEGQIAQTLILYQAPESPAQLAADMQALQANMAFIPTCHCQNTTEHISF